MYPIRELTGGTLRTSSYMTPFSRRLWLSSLEFGGTVRIKVEKLMPGEPEGTVT